MNKCIHDAKNQTKHRYLKHKEKWKIKAMHPSNEYVTNRGIEVKGCAQLSSTTKSKTY